MSLFKFQRILLIIIILFLIPFSLNSQRLDGETNKKYSEYLEKYFQNKRIPSISAGVFKDGNIQWLDSKGMIDLETLTPAKPSALYRIASITKAITAVAVIQLYERRIIDLDADITSYVTYFPKKKWKISVRQLLNHTSGIRSYKNEDEFNSKMFYSSLKDAVMTFAKDDLMFEPGTNYNYTSLGYSLLAALIENVTRMSFEDYLIENIFNPAGMKNTRVDKQREIILERVKGYEKSPDRKFVNAPLTDLSIKIAGGGLISNCEDILLFTKALLEEKLISNESLKLMTSPTILKNGKRYDYGLGFSLSSANDSIIYFGHYGRGTGFTTGFLVEPLTKTAVVFLINVRDRNLQDPARDLILISKGYDIKEPLKTLSDYLFDKYNKGGIDSSISALFQLLSNDLKTEYNLSEQEYAYFGQELTDLRYTSDAIRFLRMLNRTFPNSFTILKTLAIAYYRDGNNGLALRYFREAQLLKSDDKYVNRMINILSGK